MHQHVRTLVMMKFGSHLYGTDTPASDLDYKGVYLPALEQVLSLRIPKSEQWSSGKDHAKNTGGDMDVERYYAHYFIDLLCQGQTVALDMIHAPREHCEVWSDQWQDLVDNRRRFYTKNLKAFVGYARKQAAKYGIKGSRLAEAEQVLFVLAGADDECRLETVWDHLPLGEHTKMVDADPRGVAQYQVCGRIMGARAKVGNAKQMLAHFIAQYGQRAEQARRNEGIDWKAVSHALRAAYQVRELLMDGTISFPRPEAPFLCDVKAGKLDYLSVVGPALEARMEEVEALSEASTLPEQADRGWAKEWLMGIMDQYLCTFYVPAKPGGGRP